MDYIIGVDFDNTIVNYEGVMYAVARQRGLIPHDTRKNKKDIRDKIRQLPDGEIAWQRLQAIMYGPGMGEATLEDDVKTFFKLCKEREAHVYIISHKTEYAGFDETRTNLRAEAINWMREKGFFNADGLALSPQDVFFESTRQEKLERIRNLRCTHFIDDLEEVFLEGSFPANVERILYSPRTQLSSPGGIKVFSTWKEIYGYFLAQFIGTTLR